MNNKERIAKILFPMAFLMVLYPAMTSAAALLLGVSFALLLGNPYLTLTRKLTRPMLAWSIVGLGAGVNLIVVLKTGMEGVAFTLISLLATLAIGFFLGRLLKLDSQTSALINVGTAICGGSAIAAVSASIRAKDESTSVALGIVFILNAVALLIFPSLGHWFQLSELQFGLWSALSIHDTSSVVGASMQYGPQALEIGTTVKLVRALWIIPVAFLFAQYFPKNDMHTDGKKSPAQYPWFIGGFILTSAIVTSIPEAQALGHQVEWVAKRLLVATLFLIGSGLTVATLKKVGLKSLLHGLILWIMVAGTSLFLIKFT